MFKKTWLLSLIVVLFLPILIGCIGNPNRTNMNGETVLSIASDEGDMATVKKLIDEGADVNLKSLTGITPLMYASVNGHLDIVKLLVEKGADVNKVDDYGLSALDHAMIPGNTTVVQYLLEKGADPNGAVSSKTMRPLLYAVVFHQTDIVKILLAKGADPNLVGITTGPHKGEKALALAEKEHFDDIVELLKKAGAKE